MKLIGTDSLSFILRTKRHIIDLPVWGNPFYFFLTSAGELWSAGIPLFGFLSAEFLSRPKAEPEPHKFRQCDHRNLDIDNKPESHIQGCHSTLSLECVSRGKATEKRGLLGVIAGAFETLNKLVPKLFVEQHDLEVKGESGHLYRRFGYGK